MKKILFVIGSLRTRSFNRQMANVAKEIIGSRAEVSELDYRDLPLLNQDIEQPLVFVKPLQRQMLCGYSLRNIISVIPVI